MDLALERSKSAQFLSLSLGSMSMILLFQQRWNHFSLFETREVPTIKVSRSKTTDLHIWGLQLIDLSIMVFKI